MVPFRAGGTLWKTPRLPLQVIGPVPYPQALDSDAYSVVKLLGIYPIIPCWVNSEVLSGQRRG